MRIGKHGASVDNLFVLVTAFVFAIFMLVMMVAWNNISPLDTLWEHNDVTSDIKDDTQGFFDLFDFMFMMLYFGLHLGIIILAFLLRTHPVIYVVAVLLTAMLALLAAPISNAWDDVTGSASDLTTASNDMPVTDFVMQRLPLFEILWSFVTIVVMFGLARAEGNV